MLYGVRWDSVERRWGRGREEGVRDWLNSPVWLIIDIYVVDDIGTAADTSGVGGLEIQSYCNT